MTAIWLAEKIIILAAFYSLFQCCALLQNKINSIWFAWKNGNILIKNEKNNYL